MHVISTHFGKLPMTLNLAVPCGPDTTTMSLMIFSKKQFWKGHGWIFVDFCDLSGLFRGQQLFSHTGLWGTWAPSLHGVKL